MTMTRAKKAGHQEILTSRDRRPGRLVNARFHSPMEIAKRGGRREMTATEYREHLMGRGAMPKCRLELAVELRGQRRRQQRILGGRRLTGLVPGTKRPLAWRQTHNVERTVREALRL